jgi:hypothetical protein
MMSKASIAGERRPGLVAGVLLVAVVAQVGVAPAKDREPPPESPHLVNASRSIDDLLVRLLAALERRDREALHQLRVTEDEYRRVILRGGVAPGEKPIERSQKESDFAWGLLDTRSRYHELDLLSRFGGGRFTIRSVIYRDGVKEYALYKAYGQLQLELADASGESRTLATGSIAEVNGAFKFVSFIDD